MLFVQAPTCMNWPWVATISTLPWLLVSVLQNGTRVDPTTTTTSPPRMLFQHWCGTTPPIWALGLLPEVGEWYWSAITGLQVFGKRALRIWKFLVNLKVTGPPGNVYVVGGQDGDDSLALFRKNVFPRRVTSSSLDRST